MQQFLCKFWCEEDGQDVMEYSLLITFIALACTAFLGMFNPSIVGVWHVTNNNIQNAATFSSGS
jgi:Flp pilus assembly pilin Flp